MITDWRSSANRLTRPCALSQTIRKGPLMGDLQWVVYLQLTDSVQHVMEAPVVKGLAPLVFRVLLSSRTLHPAWDVGSPLSAG
ncbi:hypothetical protein MTO96_012589 [Rhipicephalus appendiculatus]